MFATKIYVINKRISCAVVLLKREIQEAQLPQRNSASAANVKGTGLDPPVHSPSSGYTYVYGRIRKPQRTYVKRAVRKAHFKMNRAFKVIQGHRYCCLLYTSDAADE